MAMTVEAGGAEYQVTITLSADTLAALQIGGFSLVVLKALTTTAGGGEPVAWQVTRQLAGSMVVQWVGAYEAYVSQQSGIIATTFSAPIGYGKMLQVVTDWNGNSVIGGGLPGGMSVFNTTSTQFTCGLSGQVGGAASPIAAFPLFGNSIAAFAPVEKALFLFTNYPAVQGAVMLRSFAQGCLVDCTGDTQHALSFDINIGWAWGGGPWGQVVPPNALLTPYLIELAQL